MNIFRRSGQTPLSNRALERHVTECHAELKRAREQQHSGRADWFEKLMNNALDILADRYRARAR
jgi:hypothetical protein